MSNQEWVARSLKSVWHPCTQMQHHETTPLIALKRASGAWLYDQEGKRYLDGVSSWWVNLFGHANPRINAALREQLEQVEHAMLAGFTHEPVVELSEQLSELTHGVLGHAFYASDGASAVEIALKMSYHAWRNQGHSTKQEFICLRGSYHGETIGALGVTDVALFKDAYGALIKNAHVVMSPDARQAESGETALDVAERAALDLARCLQENQGKVAALIVEPLVQCASGMAMYDAHYLRRARALCREYGVHLIYDEIAVGCGRTGTFFACEQAAQQADAASDDFWPDFLCLSKGISGGYLPLSLVLTREEIYQAFYSSDITRGFLHSHSYTGNPLACRAALTTLAIFKTDDVLASNARKAQRIMAGLAPLQALPQVKHLRQRGMIFAFDVQIDNAQLASTFSRRYFAASLQQELLLRPIGRSVYLMPPYILSDEEIDLMTARCVQVLQEVLAQEVVS